MKAWPNFESGNCNKSALGYPKPLKGTLSDQVTEDTTGYLPSSFWRETFEELVVHAGISERKSEDSSSAAAFFLMASQLPQGPPQSTALPAGSRGINFFLEHQLSWYLRVKPDYNKANKKAISTCIKKKKKKAYLKLFPCVRCCCMTLSAAAKPVTVKSSGSP